MKISPHARRNAGKEREISMDRTTAKKIAGTITNDAILEMLNTAKTRITDWGKTSKVNKCMSVGAAWCVLAEDFDVNKEYSIWSKTNMIRVW